MIKVREVKFNIDKLRRDIIQKRLIENRMSLRKAAKEIEISAATLSRVERGSKLDVDTLCKILRWLVSEPNKYFTH